MIGGDIVEKSALMDSSLSTMETEDIKQGVKRKMFPCSSHSIFEESDSPATFWLVFNLRSDNCYFLRLIFT